MQIPDNDTLTKYDPYVDPSDGSWDSYLDALYEDHFEEDGGRDAEYLEDYED